MIEVNNISYHYHGGKDVLKDVSFALEQGQFLAILGNNGVGKSTLLKCLNKIPVSYTHLTLPTKLEV